MNDHVFLSAAGTITLVQTERLCFVAIFCEMSLELLDGLL